MVEEEKAFQHVAQIGVGLMPVQHGPVSADSLALVVGP